MAEIFGVPSYELFSRSRRDVDQTRDLQKFALAVDSLADAWYADAVQRTRDRWTLDRSSDADLRRLAWERGIVLPTVVFPRLRVFLENLPTLLARKGQMRTVVDAVFLATGILVTVDVPWQIETCFTIGDSDIGDDVFSLCPAFRDRHPDDLVVGDAPIGDAHVGTRELNPDIPWQFRVRLPFAPDAQTFTLLRWAVEQVAKRGVDQPVYVLPDETEFWTVGSSRMGVDAVVAVSDCIVVGESVVGSGEMCSDDVDVLRIILPDGTAVADD